MGRPRHTWSDDQLRSILATLRALEREHPRDNAAFLDALIAEIRVLTGRIFGAAAYDGLLKNVGPQAGMTRRPSSSTVQQAVARAQLASVAAPKQEGGTPFDQQLPREALTSAVRAEVAPLHALIAQLHAVLAGPRGSEVDASQAPLLQVALADAHARIMALESQQSRLLRELGEAQARASVAETNAAKQIEELWQAFNESAASAEMLEKAAQRLGGTERFMKMQNDAVRLQIAAEADALKAENKQLKTRIDHLLLENDQYRRAATNRPR